MTILIAKRGLFTAAFVALASCSGPTTPTQVTTTTGTRLTITGATVLAPGLTTQLVATEFLNGVLITLSDNVIWQSSTPAVATVSSNGFVTALSVGTTTITARGSTGNGQVTVAVQPPNTAISVLTTCAAITSPGTYTVSTDLAATGNGCLNVFNTAAVQIDCQGHAISDLKVTNVSSAMVSNCTVSHNVYVEFGQSITFTHCSLMAGLTIDKSHSIAVSDSAVASASTQTVAITYSSSVELLRDDISNSGSGREIAGGVVLYQSADNRIEQTTISSVYDGGVADAGADDGIILNDEMGDTIQSNNVTGFFDIGIEGVGNVANARIADNILTNIGVGAIGAIYCTDWTSNRIQANRTSHVPTLVFVGYQVDSTRCGTQAPVAAFTNNQFIGNIFRDAAKGTLHRTGAPGPSMTVAMTGVVSGNVLIDNDFAGYYGPNLTPLSGFSDGGGNICATPVPGISNFVCTGGISLSDSSIFLSSHR